MPTEEQRNLMQQIADGKSLAWDELMERFILWPNWQEPVDPDLIYSLEDAGWVRVPPRDSGDGAEIQMLDAGRAALAATQGAQAGSEGVQG